MPADTASRPSDIFRETFPELQNFSLVLGGPLYQLFLKARLDDDVGSQVKRRILVITGIIWLPLLVLCAIKGTLLGGIEIPFLVDVETHARFLLAVPLFIFAEYVVHERIRGIVPQFLERNLVPPDSMDRFRDALRNAMTWRNSIAAELLLIAMVFPLAYYRSDVLALEESTWYATVGAGGTALTLPGYWFSWVSNPFFQFLLLRWMFRIVIWARFLWQASRIRLDLIATHPDRNCGLGFLSATAYAYSPLLAALGVTVAGLVASRIFHAGASLADFRLEIVVLVVLGMFLVLAPLSVFAGQILDAKRAALREYGSFAAVYSRDFDRRWIRSADHDGEPLLGTGDIQSLADLANSFQIIREIRAVPFGRDTFVQLAAAILVPFVPLVFTMIPLDELLKRVIGSVF